MKKRSSLNPMIKNHFAIFLFTVLLLMIKPGILPAQANIITSSNGKVSFVSEAPLEIIKASSDKLKAAIDKSKNSFAFSVPIQSFRGFNNDLQREHFHENYMETDKMPTASFSGKFIEQLDFAANGTYSVRAKGMFTIHGIQKERIIKGTVVVNNGNIDMNAGFTIKLEDYNIKVPKIVYEKIAEEIKIDVLVKFKK